MSQVSPQLTDATVALGALVLQFGQTYRKTCFPDGVTPESDTDHTVMLGMIACAFAKQCAPELDLGKVAQFASVHDFVEVYAKDTMTFMTLSDEEKQAKDAREAAALERITHEFSATLPWVAETIHEYETLQSPEARFVKAMDKLMPKIIVILNAGVNLPSYGCKSVAEVKKVFAEQKNVVMKYGAEWPELMLLWDALVEKVYATVEEKTFA